MYAVFTGASPRPYVTILDHTEDGVLLQCEVHGAFPKPKVEWRDSSGNMVPAAEPQVSERGGSYDVILQTTVTKTDNFSCVATQEEINHQSKPAHIYVSLSGENLPTLFIELLMCSKGFSCHVHISYSIVLMIKINLLQQCSTVYLT